MDEEKMRDTVRDLLSTGKVASVIGYEKGELGQGARPCIITSPDDADRLILTPMCKHNLTVYLTLEPPTDPEKKKIALIVKGCDARALIQVLQERGVERDDLVILGVPCTGMIEPDKLYQEVVEDDILEISEDGDTLIIKTRDGEQTLKKEDVLFDECLTCTYPTPLMADVMLGEPVEPRGGEASDPTEGMSAEERWAFWSDKFSKCTRCFACRQACPLCFCEVCAGDSLKPNWVKRSVNLSENTMWHFIRAFHHAGRCAECGACERACPVGIPLMTLNKKMARDAEDIFRYSSGTDTEAKPLLGSFKTDDEEDFIQ
ncbi:MAG: Coenzyme F420 hydrogenase/dehydrogenase, beta subunit C-terminal domain [Methanopyri archaeon]|jgi:ferredoxin|nr:Coenzyme F420 hydrogenase/dehydrogenase, beta subunit C-terminal domain [Methanopyri archaeon]